MRSARTTFHLVPAEVWASADPDQPYAAASLATEGFIHCTDGMVQMVATANRHYQADPRDFLVLTVDLEATGAPWRLDDPGAIYPHVYGPIDRAAVVAVQPIVRAPDGTFRDWSGAPEARAASLLDGDASHR